MTSVGRDSLRGKSACRYRKRALARAVAGALLAFGASAWAAPIGEQVTAGEVAVSRAGSSTLIRQTSDRAAINWQSFNIGVGESVRFVQPSVSSIALNRVLGHNASEIYGSLSANGQVFLLNPHGVLFGRGAQVNVGGLVASTLNLGDADFMAGRYRFIKEGGAGEVRNAGDILANGGYVAFIGPQVRNDGTITVANGSVMFAAGEQATLNLNGNRLIGLTVDRGAVNALAQNNGLIRADGGQVVLTAKAADQLVKSVVNNDGVIEAGTLQRVNGEIHLLGDTVTNNGTLRAQGDTGQDGGRIRLTAQGDLTLTPNSQISASGARGGDVTAQARGGTLLVDGRVEAVARDGMGGSVQLLGERVALLSTAGVDVSGKAGGGSALIGGDFQGGNPSIQNARRTVIAPGASIQADAITQGDGGKVIVWADEATRYQGNISARGGAQSGNGGMVEVSGKNTLDFSGTVNTSAANGKFGTLLLDPTNITVVAGATPNPANAADGLWAFGEDAGNQNIGAGAINTLLTANNLTLQATNNITVSSAISYTGAVDRTLTLQANNNITTSSAISTTGGRLSVVLNADADNNGAGAVAINNGITTRGGSFTASGFSVTANATGTLSTVGAANLDGGAVTIAAAAGGVVTIGKTINTTGGTASAGSDGRAGGAINVSGGTVQVATLTTTGSAGVAAGVRNGGAAGNVTLDATGVAPVVTLTGTITARGGDGVGGGIGGNGGALSISDPSLLNANITINTTQGTGGAPTGGNVTFASTVNSFNATARTLSVTAGTGNIVFGGALGATNQLQTLSANGRTVTASSVRTNGSQTYTGANGITLTGGTLQAITGTAAAQAIAFTGPVTLSGATTVQTPGGAADNITFAATSTINGAQDLTLNAGAAGNVTMSGAAGGTTPLNSVTASGAIVSVRAVTTTGSQSYSSTGVTLNGNLVSTGTAGADTINVSGPVTLAGNTTVQTSGAAADGIAFSSTINGARVFVANADQGALTFGGAVGQTTALTSISATGGALAMPAVRAGSITERSTSGTVTLNGVQTATGGGNSVVIAAATNFINNVGAGAIVPGTGRWLVYSTSPAGSTENGLTAAAGSAQPRLYNRTFSANPPATITQPGNHLIYSTQPAYTVTADNKSRAYGDANPALTFSASGLVTDDGVTDTLANAGITGAPSLGTTAVANSPVAGSPYAITVANGTLASTAGYGFSLVNGQLTVTPRAVTVSANPGQNKIYGDANPVLTYSNTSLGAGDPLSGALARAAGENVGAYAINQGTLTNAGNPNYNITFVGNTFNITPRPITVSAVTDTKVYDGVVASSATPVVSVGSLAFSDTGAFTQAFDNKNVGSGKTLTAAGIVNDGNGGNNYAVTFTPNNTGAITPAAITDVTGITANNKVYDATTTATLNTGVVGFTGILGSDVLTVASATGAFTDKNVGTGKTVNISGIALGGADAGNYTLTGNTAATTANITPATLNVTFGGVNKVYDGTTAATVTTADNRFAGDVLTINRSANFSDANAGVGKAATVGAVSLSGGDAGNYVVAPSGSANADITARGITVAANDASKVYGNADPLLSFSVGGAGLAGADTTASVFSGALVRAPGENVAGSPYAITQGTLAANSNYALTGFAQGNFTTTPRALTIAADNKANAVGNPLPPFTATYSGLALGDTAASLGGVLAFATPATIASPPGSYAIVPSGQSSGNYTISYINGTLLVTPGAGLIPGDVLASVNARNDQLLPLFVSGPVALPISFAAVQPSDVTGAATQVAQASEADALVAPGAGGAAAKRAQAEDEQRPLLSGKVKLLVDIIDGGVRLPGVK